jgi:hypothetical protein
MWILGIGTIKVGVVSKIKAERRRARASEIGRL